VFQSFFSILLVLVFKRSMTEFNREEELTDLFIKYLIPKLLKRRNRIQNP